MKQILELIEIEGQSLIFQMGKVKLNVKADSDTISYLTQEMVSEEPTFLEVNTITKTLVPIEEQQDSLDESEDSTLIDATFEGDING